MIHTKTLRHKLAGVGILELNVGFIQAQAEPDNNAARVVKVEAGVAFFRDGGTVGKVTVTHLLLTKETLEALQHAASLIEKDAANLLFHYTEAAPEANPAYDLPTSLT